MKLCPVCGNTEPDKSKECSNCGNTDLRIITEATYSRGRFSGKYQIDEFEDKIFKEKFKKKVYKKS